MASRIRPGFTSSPPRKFMFGITTFIFILGITAQVLWIVFQFQATLLDVETAEDIDSSLLLSAFSTFTSWATVTRLMVRPHHAFMSSAINGCSVYSKRHYLRLAHSGSLEQRQACLRHSSDLRPWGHRYIERIA